VRFFGWTDPPRRPYVPGVMASKRTYGVCVALGALGASALLAGVAPGHALAKPKAKAAGGPAAACGLRNLPLYSGASWTYKSGPDEMKVAVLSVAPGKDDAGAAVTAIEVEETHTVGGTKPVTTTLKATWTCTEKSGLRVAPESFFFTGEAGAPQGSTLKITEHTDVWLHPDAEVIQDNGWQEKLKAEVTRTDLGGKGAVKHPDAKIEVERYVLVHPTDPVSVPAGQFGALKVTFELRARGLVGQEKIELMIDDKQPGIVWFVKDLGIVKIEDNLKTRRSWELVTTTVPLPKQK